MLSLLTSLVLFVAGAVSQNPGPQSLVDQSNFSKLRPCAQECFFYRAGYTSDYVGRSMQCSITTTLLSRVAENECYCRTDLQISAHLTISKRVLSLCNSNTNDVTSALSVYDSYCASNGYVAAVETEESQTTPTSQAAQGGNGPTPTAGAGSGARTPTATKASAAASLPANLHAIALLWTVLLAGALVVTAWC